MTAMPERPFLKPWYRTAREEGSIVFEYGQSVVVFEGAAVARLLPRLLALLDGTRTVAELVAALGTAPAQAVEGALQALAEHGLLTEGPLPSQLAARARATAELLAAGADRPPSDVADRLAERTAGVVGSSSSADDVAALLLEGGLGGVERLTWEGEIPGGLDVVVAAPSPSELPRLAPWNGRALAAEAPWLQLLPFDGRAAVVGPLYVPGQTCCYECYLRRRASVVDYARELRALAAAPAPYPVILPLERVVAGLGVFVLLRWLGPGDDFLPGFLYLLEVDETIALTSHLVYRVPRCAVCAHVGGAQAPPLPWHEAAFDGAH